jgi:DNA-binding transcriptional ArsR family regulator
MKPTAYKLDPFVMLYHEELDKVFHHAQRRELKPMDGLTLLAVLRHLNWKSGKAEVTSEQLGEQLGTEPRVIRSSLARLKKLRLVAFMKEGTSYFYSVHPSLMRAGRQDCRNLTVQRWKNEELL